VTSSGHCKARSKAGGGSLCAAAVQAMLSNHVRRLPMVWRSDRKLVGIGSIDDLADHYELAEQVGLLIHDHSYAVA
jgi:hypothetical protein